MHVASDDMGVGYYLILREDGLRGFRGRHLIYDICGAKNHRRKHFEVVSEVQSYSATSI